MKDSNLFNTKTINVELTKGERCKLNFEAWRRGMSTEAYVKAVSVSPKDVKPRRNFGQIIADSFKISAK